MYPCEAKLYLAPISADRFFDKKVGSLRDVSGIDMSALVPFATREMTAWGIRGRRVRPESVLADPHCMKTIDLYLVQPADLQVCRGHQIFFLCSLQLRLLTEIDLAVSLQCKQSR